MSDLPNHTGDRGRTPLAARVDTYAPSPFARAVCAVDFAAVKSGWLQALCDACADHYDDAVRLVVREMQDAGLSPVEIAEQYVPAAARILGDAWCEDEHSFAHVTIGCSRLHGVLRDLGPQLRPMAAPDIHAPSVLVAVAEDIYHTLGATVLTGMLRRSGYNVKLWLGARPSEMEAMLRNGDYQAVLISSSSGESLETVRKIVKSVKRGLARPPMVILGGTAIDDGEITIDDALALTGADHATNDPAKAIELCARAMQDRSRTETHPVRFARRT